MSYYITETYKMKREIINFSKKLSAHHSSPEAKFTADMTCGIVVSKSCLLTQISQRLQENTKKRYTVDRLSDHLARGIPEEALTDYLRYIRSIIPSEPVIHIDDPNPFWRPPDRLRTRCTASITESQTESLSCCGMPIQASEIGSSRKDRTKTSCVSHYQPDVFGYIPPRRNCSKQLCLVAMPFL